MYTGYLKSNYGLIKLKADDKYLRSLKIVEKEDEDIVENDILQVTRIQLEEYFNGMRAFFSLPLHFEESFKGDILKSTHKIKYGTTMTYADLANKENSKAYRAVGTIMARNEIPIIIPCHRVIRKDGSIGKYSYGDDMKRKLLQYEKENRKKFKEYINRLYNV